MVMEFENANLNSKEVQELRTAFTMLDKNEDGRICDNDLKLGMEKLGYAITTEQLNSFVEKLKTTGGLMKEEHFIEWMSEMYPSCKGDRDCILENAFNVFDKNKDGFITRDELREGFIALGESMSETMLNIMFEEADLDKDGKINFKEFSVIMGR